MNKKILVVEDDRDLAELSKNIIIVAGHEPILANNGKEALDLLDQETPDLILLDLMMPEMDGFEFLEIMKSNEKTRDIKVMVVSALKDLKSKEKAFSLGAVEYLEKGSYHIDILIDKINSLVS